MHAGGQTHPLQDPCRNILQLVEQGQLEGVTSVEVIQEILHRFVHIHRRDIGTQMAVATLDLFSPLLPVTESVMRRMPGLVGSYEGLSARDLLHVATCIEESIEVIISPDEGFDQVKRITRVAPDDGDWFSHQTTDSD